MLGSLAARTQSRCHVKSPCSADPQPIPSLRAGCCLRRRGQTPLSLVPPGPNFPAPGGVGVLEVVWSE